MAPDIKSEERDHSNQDRPPAGLDTSAAEAALKAKLSRKRTKTGCLTCRKRRIKCGEERPTCRNCFKSKRHCEGYNQRVVFKQPTFDYRPLPNGAHITFQAGPIPGPVVPFAGVHAPDASLMNLPQYHGPPLDGVPAVFDPRSQSFVHAPQHQLTEHLAHPYGAPAQQSRPSHVHQLGEMPASQMYDGNLYAQSGHTTQQLSTSTQQTDVPPQGPIMQMSVNMPDVVLSQGHGLTSPNSQPTAAMCEGAPPSYLAYGYRTADMRLSHQMSFGNAPPEQPLHMRQPSNDARSLAMTDQDHVSPTSVNVSRTVSYASSPVAIQQNWTSIAYVPRPELTRLIDYPASYTTAPQSQVSLAYQALPATQPSFHSPPPQSVHDAPILEQVTPTTLLRAAAVESHDDDYYDVELDEEMDEQRLSDGMQSGESRQALSTILNMNQLVASDDHLRRYDTFIYPGFLDQYRVEQAASPLRNDATKRVFAHFISVTGPSLSIFERHHRNTSVLFSEGSVPFSQRGLWTDTMPKAALRNRGLLHSMLALASLHIARLQNASVTPSMQHYAWALKDIHRYLGNPKKRLNITTIAASLLLGFYEIMTADHMKWNMHLAGSKQLFVETDFATMTQTFRQMKSELDSQHRVRGNSQSHRVDGSFTNEDMLEQIMDVDERVVSDLIGEEVRYYDHGKVEMSPEPPPLPRQMDLSKFEVLKDLYWWYCKQDVYQSIVSGNPLLMDFTRWASCPPRAPLGRGDAVVGSFDHLVLLLGRIAEFAARDRARKLKQIDANGGQWRPPPGMQIQRPSQTSGPDQPPPTPVSATAQHPTANANSRNPVPAQQPQPTPAFYGMAPPPRANVQMPSSYAPPPTPHTMPTPQSAQSKESVERAFDLPAATQVAKEEFGRIKTALLQYRESLGPAFQALGPEHHPQKTTAFGPAVLFRSADIGCLWAIYHMAEIIAHRSHPDMPPAAHVAAAVSASQTHFHAQQIGRIAAGLYSGLEAGPLNPTLGAALNESCMPSFFAAVQYHDPAQRDETVRRIFSIARRTGWGSAELIANGCETAWVKTAQAGRGPPYTRILRPETSDDPRLNGSWERLDMTALPDEADDGDRRLVTTKATARLNWAIGVMGVEADVVAR